MRDSVTIDSRKLEADISDVGISMEDLGAEIGAGRSTVYRWVQEGRAPMAKLERLAAFLGHKLRQQRDAWYYMPGQVRWDVELFLRVARAFHADVVGAKLSPTFDQEITVIAGLYERFADKGGFDESDVHSMFRSFRPLLGASGDH